LILSLLSSRNTFFEENDCTYTNRIKIKNSKNFKDKILQKTWKKREKSDKMSNRFLKPIFHQFSSILASKKYPKIPQSHIKNRTQNNLEKTTKINIKKKPVLARNGKRDFISEMSAQEVMRENEGRQKKTRKV
jgi:hypothetical protein